MFFLLLFSQSKKNLFKCRCICIYMLMWSSSLIFSTIIIIDLHILAERIFMGKYLTLYIFFSFDFQIVCQQLRRRCENTALNITKHDLYDIFKGNQASKEIKYAKDDPKYHRNSSNEKKICNTNISIQITMFFFQRDVFTVDILSCLNG